MIGIKEVIEAAERIRPFAHHTPVFSSRRINKICDCEISFKCENLQRVGAFKFRGALNAMLQISDLAKTNGVVTHSSGNHAQALALAAQLNNIRAFIVMPKNAPKVKVNAVKEYGAEIVFCDPTLEAREIAAQKIIVDLGAEFIHPYDDYRIIAGQATCAYEFLRQIDGLADYIIAPVGGGGLLSGTAISVKAKSPKIKVIGAEPANADDAYKSFRAGEIIPQTNPNTIADGLLTSLGIRNFEIIKEFVDDILLCDENDIYLAMKMIFENLKLIVEPSGAVPLAIVLANKSVFSRSKIGIIISGGNIDLQSFVWRP